MKHVAFAGSAAAWSSSGQELRAGATATEVVEISGKRQLFLDDGIIEHRERVDRTYHQFQRHPRNPLLVPGRAWERANFGYGTVMRDATTDIFRAWYTNNGARRQAAGEARWGQELCYATSQDGLHWDRPNLGLYEIAGIRDNNVVAVGLPGYSRGLSVIHDANARDPLRQYVHLYQTPKGTCPSYSPDGLHWTTDGKPIFQASDVGLLAFDPSEHRFFAFSAATPRVRGFSRRSIEMTETDLETWREFKPILIADEADDAGALLRIARLRSVLDYDNPKHYHCQFHNMVGFPYESLTLGIIAVWDNVWSSELEPLFAGGRDRGVVHLQLAWTRDRDWRLWSRPERRLPLVEPSDPGEWDCAAQLPLLGPLPVGDELWLYYSGFSTTFNGPRGYGALLPANEKVPPNGIGVASMRLDGFASLDAGPRGGTVTTRPFLFSGSTLAINAIASGHITVELQDVAGNPLQEFNRASLAGNSTGHSLRWDGLGKLAGHPIRLRFYLWNARLFAFQFR